MTPVEGRCPHCQQTVLRTRTALTGRPVVLNKVVWGRDGTWIIDHFNYAVPSRRGTHDTHPCQQEAPRP